MNLALPQDDVHRNSTQSDQQSLVIKLQAFADRSKTMSSTDKLLIGNKYIVLAKHST